MIALPKRKMTVDEFLAWSETLPKEAGKYELWDGEVVVKHGPVGQQQAERSQHWETKGAMFAALREAIKRAALPCFAAVDGASVRMPGDRLAEPDVLVYCGQRVPRGVLEVPNPVIVVEVLSPGTKDFDRGTKLQGYFTLPSLYHYLIVDPDRPLIIHHKRGSGDALETRFVQGPMLGLDPPGLEVDLTEILSAP
ncbi:MAG: Uma2 family endonuclease [Hyphomicrobiaceae bacterium]